MKILDISSVTAMQRKLKYKKYKYIIVHYTAIKSEAASVRVLSDMRLPTDPKVSAHFIVSGSHLYCNTPICFSAWHAGISAWQGDRNLNSSSIGIEIVNNGIDNFTSQTYSTLKFIILRLQGLFDIPDFCVLGHQDIAPNRKRDPGKHFNWSRVIRDCNMISDNKFAIPTSQVTWNYLYSIGYRYGDFHQQKKAYDIRFGRYCSYPD